MKLISDRRVMVFQVEPGDQRVPLRISHGQIHPHTVRISRDSMNENDLYIEIEGMRCNVNGDPHPLGHGGMGGYQPGDVWPLLAEDAEKMSRARLDQTSPEPDCDHEDSEDHSEMASLEQVEALARAVHEGHDQFPPDFCGREVCRMVRELR